MSGQDDKTVPPVGAASTVVVLTGTRAGTTVESRVFNSVAAAAVYFAYVAKKAYGRNNKLSGDALLEAIAAEAAVLFAGYDNTTGEDKDTVQLDGVRYEAKLTAVLDEALASDDGRAIDAKEGA